MRSAISLAARGLGTAFPNPAVGCLIVKEGVVVGRGWTQPGGRPHAETQALTQAGTAAQGATAYVTLEPCAHTGKTPPCANALVDAKIARLVVAITDPDPRVSGLGLRIIKRAGISVTENICRDQAWRANLGFFLSLSENRPMFTLKLATDALGHIPGPKAVGADKWVTSPQARNRGHLLRSTHDAVLFGIGTVLSDDPKYTCRLAGLEQTSPVRVVLDSQLRLSLNSNLLKTADVSPIWVICGQDAQTRDDLLRANITIIRSPQPQPDPTWVAAELAKRGVTRVLIESGPKIVNAFLEAGLVDEIAWFRANKVLDKNFVPAFHDKLLEKLELCLEAVLQAGSDHLELYAKGL
ncbi:MAG: bifunctional diaminohydroxyphosphoribosylaminopyrimidine deaminase/5-amino-6-(5-phosphoribosylamino)uracil reductase RibD [Magnetovibrio sp.]|nr:bifunctional diaminohydroxyphosphoribosylaminopyrimidine deaminase/5-amino-6-(5-phosphoribosylamino)uracil reductase RibD [Magnetovibrio sp.]